MAYTVQLNAERDKLEVALKSQKEETSKAKQVAASAQQGSRQSGGGGASLADKDMKTAAGVSQSAVYTSCGFANPRRVLECVQSFAAVHLIIVGLIFFFVGKFM